jgi:hypothetical protein
MGRSFTISGKSSSDFFPRKNHFIIPISIYGIFEDTDYERPSLKPPIDRPLGAETTMLPGSSPPMIEEKKAVNVSIP